MIHSTNEVMSSGISAPAVEGGKQNQQRESYQLLFERNPLPMWIYDLETLRFLEVNEAAIHHYGYSVEEFLSMTIKDIRPPEDHPRLEKAVEKVRSTGSLNSSSHWKHIRKNGSTIAVEITGFPLEWNGSPAELIIAHDVTEQFGFEEQLRNSRASLKAILESTDQAIWSVDRNFRYTEFNEHFRKFVFDSTGQKPGIGIAIDEILPPDEAEFWKNHCRRALLGDQFSIEISSVVSSDVRHYKVIFTPVKMAGTADAVTVFCQDITEFKRSGMQKENLLKALKERVKELRVLHKTARILQREDEQLSAIFQCVVQLLPNAWQYPEVAAARIRFDGEQYSTKNYYDAPWRQRGEFSTSSGKSGCIEVVYLEERPSENIGPFLNEEKELLVSLSEMIRVFLENREMKAALKESEQRFRHLIENSTDVVVTVTPEGTLTYASPSIVRVLGYSEDELVGRPFLEIVHEEDRQHWLKVMMQIMQDPSASISVEVRTRHKDHRWIWVETTGVNMLQVPSVRAIVGNFRDVTDRKTAMDELSRSREWFKTIFEASRDGIVVEGKEIIVYANSAFARLYSYDSPEELIGRHVSVIQSDRDNERMLEFGRRRLRGEFVPSTYEFKGKARGGEDIDVEASVSTSVIGGSTFIVTMLRDIRDRKSAEKALEESEERYRNFFQDDLSGNFISTQEGKIISCNPSFARIFGFSSPEEATMTSAGTLFKNAGERENYGTLLEKNPSLENLERAMVRKDGTMIDVVANIGGGFDEKGRLIYIKGYILDVTVQKQAVKKLSEQAALLDITRDAILVRDLDGRILFWNKGAERMYGWNREEALGSQITDVLFVTQKHAFIAGELEVLSKGEWSRDFQQTTKEGRELVVSSTWTLVRDDAGNPKSILMVDTDITEKKSLESQFLRTQRLESLGTLAGGIAHDLNNVLGPILMGAEVMKRRTSDIPSLKLLDSMEASARRGAEMVKQVLAFARGIEGERAHVPVKHLIDEMITLITETFPKSLVIRKNLHKDVPAVLGDATQIHQVLLNLAVNARDAMPEGGTITLELSSMKLDDSYAKMHPDAKPGRYVVMEVSDSGKGILPSILEKIFDPFFTTKEQGKGTGLGLSTVLGIVRGHGGFINVYSEVSKGTKFRVFLPAAADSAAFSAGEEEKVAPSGNGELILVVDDESSIRDISRITLESHGYQVLTAADGTEAVAAFMERKDEVKAMITDMAMPFMDGPATIRALNRLKPDLPIIACSGLFANNADVNRFGPCVKGFLLKPFTAAKLLTMLHGALHNEPTTHETNNA